MSIQAQYPELSGVKIQQTALGCKIAANLQGFYADEVAVKTSDEALVVEMIVKQPPQRSYYLGEIEPERHIRTIPLSFDTDDRSVMTHYNNGKLEILVQRTMSDQAVAAA